MKNFAHIAAIFLSLALFANFSGAQSAQAEDVAALKAQVAALKAQVAAADKKFAEQVELDKAVISKLRDENRELKKQARRQKRDAVAAVSARPAKAEEAANADSKKAEDSKSVADAKAKAEEAAKRAEARANREVESAKSDKSGTFNMFPF